MKIFLDDLRNCPIGWTLCRTAKDAIDLLASDQVIKEISFDHDLGGKLTGNDVALAIETMIANKAMHYIPKWDIHSANPVGRGNIQKTMLSARNILKGL